LSVKKVCLVSLLFLSCVFMSSAASAQNEIAFTVGGITRDSPAVSRSSLGRPCPITGCVFPLQANSLDAGFALNASFARRFVNLRLADFSLELPVTVVPSRGTDIAVSNIRTVAFTPAIKVGLNPNGGISPFAAVGFGLAHFSGGSTSSSNAFALNVGGGADFKTPIPLVALRGEARYLRTGLPDIFQGSGNLNNVYFGAGVVFKF
jgi:opacity protein-like surface antigen